MEELRGINANWIETKDRLKKQFELLSNEDLLLIEGKQEELIGRLEIKLGKTREEIRLLISDL